MLYDINYMFQDVVENSFLVDLCDVRQQSLRTEHSDIRMFLLGVSQHWLGLDDGPFYYLLSSCLHCWSPLRSITMCQPSRHVKSSGRWQCGTVRAPPSHWWEYSDPVVTCPPHRTQCSQCSESSSGLCNPHTMTSDDLVYGPASPELHTEANST